MKKTELGLTTFQGDLDRLENYLKRENPDSKHFGELRAVILKALRRFLDQEMPKEEGK